MQTTLQFLGAARTVTGSKHLLSHGGTTVLLDCGLFQGLKEWRLKNWEPFPLPLGQFEDIVLSHAHLDHTGYLPRLFRLGFDGRIFATPATRELCEIMLPDSGHIQEEDARYANKERFSKHTPALPLYTREDAEKTLDLIRGLEYGETQKIGKNISFAYQDAGHILGSAMVRFELLREDGKKPLRVAFTGDLGRYGEHNLPDPEPVAETDYLIVESTYGDRIHEDSDVKTELADIANRTARRGGVVVIPSFAVGRTQELLATIHVLQDQDRIPASIPVYLDSPLAIKATQVFLHHPEDQCFEQTCTERDAQSPILCHNLHLAASVQESMAINNLREPAIIISASGMCEAGRILHHLKLHLPNPRNTVVFVGYQAEGTRGRIIQDQAREVKIHGQYVPIRAEVATLEAMSAHADREEIFRWLAGFQQPPRKTFVVHGEEQSANSLASEISRRLGWRTHVPFYLEKVVLD